MKEHPELKKRLHEVEEKQNRWIGRGIETHDAYETPNPKTGQAPVASVLEETMPKGQELERLPGGSAAGPSVQWGGKVAQGL